MPQGFGHKLPISFYQKQTASVAKALLGKRLVRVWRGKRRCGIIVETEAYLGARDAACHTWKNRRTKRVNSMYLPGGHAYIYLIYGMHHCFNVVTRGVDQPEAVLVRALAPDSSFDYEGRMDGPGRLCKALLFDKKMDGMALDGEIAFLEDIGIEPKRAQIGTGPRIGVDYAGEAAAWPLRFFWSGSPYLSRRER